MDFETIEKIKQIIEQIIARLGVEAKVSPEDSLQKGLVFNISSADSRLLIGKLGSNLQAIQLLTQAIVSKKLSDQGRIFFTLDVNEYRKNREWHLKEIVRAAAEKVKMTGRSVDLEPMPPFERRMVHAWITEQYSELETASIGSTLR